MRLCIEPPPVYFMHVPKTGGVALGQWLRRAYGSSYFDLDLPQIVGLTGRNIQDFRCYHAWHHDRSLFAWLGRADLIVFTMVRDPIERAVSAFKFHQRRLVEHPERFTDGYRATMKFLSEQTLEECLSSERVTEMLSDSQVRVLGSRRDYPAFIAARRQHHQTDRLLRPYAVPWLGAHNTTSVLYTNASAWLDEMAVVGLTERYAESLLMIGDLLGIPVPADLPRANVNPQRTDPAMRYRDQLAPEVVAQLQEMNCYDQELYAHAQELFEQQWARYQTRPRRTYSIAPRLRTTLNRTKSGLKGWLRRTWPGVADQLSQMRAKHRSKATINGQRQ
jgi:hypothetical protein